MKSLIESIRSSVYLFGLLPRVSGTEMRCFQETDKSPHVRQPCAAEVNEYWNEITLGPFCSHPLSKLVFIVIIYGDGR